MSDDPGADPTNDRRAATETLLRMIEYAIAEGTALQSPTFVALMRNSRLELINKMALPQPATTIRNPQQPPDDTLN